MASPRERIAVPAKAHESVRAKEPVQVKEPVKAQAQKPEAPWVEVYAGFYVLETYKGCLVKVEGNVTFIPDGALASFLVPETH
jgi:hypothetical protein